MVHVSDDETQKPPRMVDLIDAELCKLNPTRKPLSESAKAAIEAAVADAPPMSHGQARRVARLLRGRSGSYGASDR